jgi:hypothetical protein
MLVSLDSDDVGLDIQNCYLFLKIRHATEEARANEREGERAKKGNKAPWMFVRARKSESTSEKEGEKSLRNPPGPLTLGMQITTV